MIDVSTYAAGMAQPGVDSNENGLVTLFVCRGFSGTIVRAEVDASRTIDQLIPDLADQIEYASPDWEKIGLYNLTRDFEYDPDQIMSQTPTRSGDLIIMADGAGCHKTD